MPEEPAPETRCIHGGQDRKDPGLAPPIFPASVYAFGSLQESIDTFEGRRHAPLYARYGHPTGEEVEARIASLEGAEACILTASGMSVVSLLVAACCQPGDHVIASKEQYGGTTELLRMTAEASGVEVEFLPLAAFRTVGKHLRGNTRLIVLESPSNPLMRLANFAELFGSLGSARPLVVLDGTLGTPLGQNALAAGFDLVFHSATKYLGGHDDLTAGAVSGKKEWIDKLRERRRVMGAMCDPFCAWLLGRGLKTLSVRWERQCWNAGTLAERLEAHPRVSRVYHLSRPSHPDHALARKQMRSFGALLAFEVAGGLEAARRAYDRFRLIARAPSLGGVESMSLHPVTSSHRQLSLEERKAVGISDGLLRLSVGIENIEDLWRDVSNALKD
jgi:cystathionine beta-lyase/cystathionine gamma-synthase